MKGIYVCLFEIKRTRLKVGSLGEIPFEEGTYLYVGSAQKALEKRVKRHKSTDKANLHWHIDYVSNEFPAIECYALRDAGKEYEEDLASVLSMMYPYIKGFGSGDSSEKSHFFKVDRDVKNILDNFAKLRGGKWERV